MYPNNSFSRRRATGWAERRRYFRKLSERAAANSARQEAAKKTEPVKEKEYVNQP